MSSHILENSSLIDNIKYEWDIRLLFALSEPLNGVPNIIRKVHWTASAILELLGETHAESIFGEISLNISELNYDNLIPYENYIPIQNDLSDLQKVVFLLKQEDKTAHTIAMNGQNLGKEIFSHGAIEDYVYKLLSKYSKKMVIEKMLEEYKHFSSDVKFSKREKLIRSMASQHAIKAGVSLSQKEMQQLTGDLFSCEVANSSPNGKPTYMSFYKEELDKLFGR